MIKISHESPLQLLQKSRHYNDFDYALVHLFEKYPEYYDFFEASLKIGREVILDNSIFELGEAFAKDEFARWIEKLKPSIYVVPDALNDYERTIDNYEEWLKDFGQLPGKKMGVVQGTTYKELVDCYRYMEMNADVVAISFDYKFYNIVGYGFNEEQRWSDGRVKFIRNMVLDAIIDPAKPIHLLGCSLPKEFINYRDLPINIRSLDTSNPVLHGMYGIKYGEHGLLVKHRVKMAEVFEEQPNKENLDIIDFNIKKFRELVNGKEKQ